jgi:hypothetical protein
MARDRFSGDDPVRPEGPARLAAFFRGRWRGVRGPARIGFALALGLVVVLGGAITIGPAASAAEGHGTRGYYIARSYFCHVSPHAHTCEWRGDFTRRPGGPVLRRAVRFNGQLPAGMHEGEAVPAVDTGAPDEVYTPGNRSAWITALACLVLGGIWSLAFMIVIVMRIRYRNWPFPARP